MMKDAAHADDCIAMMRTRAARNFMYRHLEGLGTFVDSFHEDPYIHARHSGRRSAGLTLQYDLKRYAPEEYKQMIKEQHQ